MAGPVDILIVDDRQENLLLLDSILARDEYRLVRASSGTEALRYILERDFAVILLDVMMPEMDGFEVAELIKRRERSRDTPIIFLTAGGPDNEFINRGYSVGAVDYLIKPLDPDMLRAKVGIFVRLYIKDQQLREQAEALRIAERRERELALAELRVANERRYRNLAEAIPQIVWSSSLTGRITYVNRQWSAYTGRPLGDALADALVAVHSDDAPTVNVRWREAIAGQSPFELECRLRRHDGEFRWHLCRAVPEREGDDTIVGWLGTYTDIDERRRALDASQVSLHARDEFLSIASHELRTPLTTLNLRLESLTRDVNATQPSDHGSFRRRLASAQRQGDRLKRLVDSLLDVSRITSGTMTLHREPVDVADLAAEVIERFTEMAIEVGCHLELHASAPVVGQWDRLRIDQILQNLISNALSYAPGAPIEVTLEATDIVARLSVRDHGPGIADHECERIFGQFERVVSARNPGGLGMGLFIARQIAISHGGDLRVERAADTGARFILELPRAGVSEREQVLPECRTRTPA